MTREVTIYSSHFKIVSFFFLFAILSDLKNAKKKPVGVRNRINEKSYVPWILVGGHDEKVWMISWLFSLLFLGLTVCAQFDRFTWLLSDLHLGNVVVLCFTTKVTTKTTDQTIILTENCSFSSPLLFVFLGPFTPKKQAL